MFLGSIATNFTDLTPEEGLALMRRLGVTHLELACGGFFDDLRFGDPRALLADRHALARWQYDLDAAGVTISALAVHGAPLSPDRAQATRHTEDFIVACEFAEAIGVSRITLLAGLPEAVAGDRSPAWIVVADPGDNVDVLERQWQERVLPYWRGHAAIADDRGVRLCFEMVGSDVLHNPPALLRLRAEIGDVIGCNFDPSHLFWQGIDPLRAIEYLDGAIYHAHAKDTEITDVAAVTGLLDVKPFALPQERAWNFRTAGQGHGVDFWRSYVAALQSAGYDDVISIEHEDARVDGATGLSDAVAFLRPLVTTPVGV